MVRPVKHAEQFKTQWKVLEQAEKHKTARGNNKVLKAALKIVQEEAVHDPEDAKAQFEAVKAKFTNDSKTSQKLVEKAEGLIKTAQSSKEQKIKQLTQAIGEAVKLPYEEHEPPLLYILTVREKLAATDDPTVKKNAPKIFDQLAELQHLTSHEPVDDKAIEELWKGFIVKIQDPNMSIAQDFNLNNLHEKGPAFQQHLETQPDKVKFEGLAFLRLRELRSQEEKLKKLGLTNAQIDRYPVDTPYLGRNGVEPVIGFRRRATIVMQNIRGRILPSYAEKAREGQSYRKAIEFSKKNAYNPPVGKTDRQYGGDNPADLQADLARTLARANPIQGGARTQIAWVAGDSVMQAKEALGPHKRLGLVNCANKDRYGGSWDVARGSQEESLFRQSNLSAALKSTVDKLRGRRQNHIPAAGVIVNPGVTFMDPGNEGKTFSCDVVSIAAVDYRKHNTRQHAEIAKAAKQAGVTPDEYMKQATKNKYAAMFGAFLENGNTDLLISLPGLGAFQNDREMVMSILNELLINDDAPFKNMFNSVTFNVFNASDPTVASLKGIGVERLERQEL